METNRPTTRERRKSSRVPVCVPVRVLGPGRVLKGSTRSLSTSGASMLLEHTFEVGQWIKMDILLPGGPLVTNAQVVNNHHDNPNHIGVRFESLRNGNLALLHDVVANHPSRANGAAQHETK